MAESERDSESYVVLASTGAEGCDVCVIHGGGEAFQHLGKFGLNMFRRLLRSTIGVIPGGIWLVKLSIETDVGFIDSDCAVAFTRRLTVSNYRAVTAREVQLLNAGKFVFDGI